MVTLFCAIVGEAGSAFPVDIGANKSVGHLKKAIKEEKTNDLKDVDADKLQLFLAKTGDGVWLDGAGAASVALDEHGHPRGFVQMDPLLWIKNPKHFGANFRPGEDQIHVLVVVPEGAVGSTLLQQVNTAARQGVVWYGMQGSVGRGEGIDLNDERTLSRSAVTAGIIGRLEETHVVLVKSPPMTGKTSLATLVSRALANRQGRKEKAAIFNFSALRISESQTFEDVFKQQCEVT